MLGDFIYSQEAEDSAYGNTAYSNTASNTTYNNSPYSDMRYDNTPYEPYNGDTPQRVEKTAKRFLLLAAFFACGGLIWIFCISPVMVPVRASVSAIPGLDRQDVLNIAGIGRGATYIAVNADEAQARLAAHYLVESAKVVKRFPDRLSIFLEPRKAVAVAFARVNGRLQPVYFDRYGVVFKIGGGTSAGGEMPPSWLPVVSGVLDDNLQPWLGMKLSVPLFSKIGAITDDDPNIWKAISEISVAWKGSEMYDLVLYPVHDSIRLRMGSDISKDTIYYALLMFDVSRRFGGSVPDEIDVRSGIGVFRN